MIGRTFDPSRIVDAGIRAHFDRLLRRADAMSAAIAASVGAQRKPIRTRYVRTGVFNAAIIAKSDRYEVELASCAPYFLMILMHKLLCDPALLPWLESKGPAVSDYEIAFQIDRRDFTRCTPWRVELNHIRAFAAKMMADMASTFVLAHEFGHVIAGHLDLLRATRKRRRYAELSFDRNAITDAEFAQLLELEADSVGAGFLHKYIEELIADARTNADTRQVFAHDEHSAENAAAIACACVYALFAYVRGAQYKLNFATSHPHPMVRTHCVKQVLLQSLDEQGLIDAARAQNAIDTRLEEMMVALERIGLDDQRQYSDHYIGEVNAWRARLAAQQIAMRELRMKWSWIEWGD